MYGAVLFYCTYFVRVHGTTENYQLRNALMQRVKQKSHVQTVVLYLDRCAAFQSASVCADPEGCHVSLDRSIFAASAPRQPPSPAAGWCCCVLASQRQHRLYRESVVEHNTTEK